MNEFWSGLRQTAHAALTQRDYSAKSLSERLASSGAEAGEVVVAGRAQLRSAWIPGVELFGRKIFAQRHRGFFGEFAREHEGTLAAIGLWPQQWAAARMFAGTAKGFHIHPPHIPPHAVAEEWFRAIYIDEPENFTLRPYALEQWDVMFFLQGCVEMLLLDERAGLERRLMRFFIQGDDQRGSNNVAVVIPPGVAHAMRVEGTVDAIVVYGTSTPFDPACEGRIADGVERAPLPEDWTRYIGL
jgi:dTDP-4-dehydrorhamnose 3,5-epimerase-like enzyme